MSEFIEFYVEFTKYGEHISHATIKIHKSVFDAVDDEWRSVFYNLHTPQEIAAHITHNVFNNRLSLSQMDGWADMPDDRVVVMDHPDFGMDVEVYKFKD